MLSGGGPPVGGRPADVMGGVVGRGGLDALEPIGVLVGVGGGAIVGLGVTGTVLGVGVTDTVGASVGLVGVSAFTDPVVIASAAIIATTAKSFIIFRASLSLDLVDRLVLSVL